ncbi:hypothetical protein D7X33_04880 [Butyricicoccus sp. 1XD8-22]|nr:hypothetical protein D7X33_04880 [Butyricicoccus sp. 1XD8-22]
MKTNPAWEEGKIYRLLAINSGLLSAGAITQQEHDLVRRLELKKLTKLRQNGTIEGQVFVS